MGKILGVVFLAGIAYMMYSWNTSFSDINDVCNFAAKGKRITVILDKINSIDSLKYSDFEDNNKQLILVHSSVSFGRHTCIIEYKDKEVVESEYLFMD